MSVGGMAFWSSDYAYNIMSANEISRITLPATSNSDYDGISPDIPQREPAGFAPRVDEYTPSLTSRPNYENSQNLAGSSAIQAAISAYRATDTEELDEISEENTERQQGEELSDEERQIVEELKARDAEVRAHEQAHAAVGGAYISGGISYTMQTGPDGKQYAIGGEVSIDTSPVRGDPEATLEKMQTIQSAAMAPANPSDADRAVAAAAAQTAAAARAELAERSVEQSTENSETRDHDHENDHDHDDHGENGVRVQNEIVSAISAYTANFGVETLSTRVNFVA